MKKLTVVLSAILAMLMGTSAFAAEFSAKVVSAEGKVERLENNTWVPIKVGDVIKKGTVVQTGFKSTMVLAVHESMVTVSPLSRMTVEQFTEQEEKDSTSLFVSTGTVTSDVRKRENRKVGFVVRSPVATASVRGTIVSMINHFRGAEVRNFRGVIDTWPTGENAKPVVAEGDNEPVQATEEKRDEVVLRESQGVSVNNDGNMGSLRQNAYANSGNGGVGMQTAAMSEISDSSTSLAFMPVESNQSIDNGFRADMEATTGTATFTITFPEN